MAEGLLDHVVTVRALDLGWTPPRLNQPESPKEADPPAANT